MNLYVRAAADSALASGGMTQHEMLQVATRSSAAVEGRSADIGTLEADKYADLLIFDQGSVDIRQDENSMPRTVRKTFNRNSGLYC